MKILLIINPVSGDTDKNNFIEQAKKTCSAYGYNCKIHKTSGEHDREKIMEIARTFNPEKAVVAGGDGTVLTAALALTGMNIPLGIVPAGSANGFARELKISSSLNQAFKDALLTVNVRRADLLKINNEYRSLHLGDLGVNARIIQSFEQSTERGMAAYAKSFIRVFNNIEQFEYEVKSPAETRTGEAVMLALCNGRFFGTGIPLNTIGNPFDGKFEIVIIKQAGIRALINAGLSFLDDSFAEKTNTEVISLNKAKISFNQKRLLQLDGELIGKFSEIEAEIIPSAVPLLTVNKA